MNKIRFFLAYNFIMNYNSGNFGGIIVVEENKINYREEIKKCFDDIKHIKTFYKQIPNLLTFSRALFGPFVSCMFLMGYPVAGVIATALLCFTDMIDGKLARKWNVVSKFGADLDAFCDKLMFLWLALPLIINNPIILLNFIFEGIISGINVFGRMKGLNTKTVFSGKVKTCLLSLMLISGYLVEFLSLPILILNTLIGITIFSQGIAVGNYIIEYKKLCKENELSKLNKLNDSKVDDLEEQNLLVKEESLSDSLKKEREFILGFKEPDKKKELNVKIRNKENEKKSEI